MNSFQIIILEMAETYTPPPNEHNGDKHEKTRDSPRRDRSPRRSRSRSPQSKTTSVYISGLSSRAKESELESLFRPLLSKYGKLLSVKLIKDPRSGDCRGFGFVKMELPEEVDDAVRQLDGYEIDGRKITAEKVRLFDQVTMGYKQLNNLQTFQLQKKYFNQFQQCTQFLTQNLIYFTKKKKKKFNNPNS